MFSTCLASRVEIFADNFYRIKVGRFLSILILNIKIMKRINLKQEEGYILPYLLVAFLLITTTLALTVNLFYFYNKYEIKKINKKKLELACSSAIQQFISQNRGKIKADYTLIIDSTEVNLACRQKGLYLQVSAFAKNRLDSTLVTYLLAERISQPFENAVVISRSSLNAVVAGKTKVVGDIVGSSNNYKMENLPGVGKASGKWIEGKTKIDEMIPQRLYADSLFLNVVSQKNKIESSRIKTYNGSITLDSNTFKHYDPLKCFYVKGDVTINGKLLDEKRRAQQIFVEGRTRIESNTKTNIELEIYCDSTIIISPGCEIKNLLLYSKSNLIISRDVSCKNVQFFSERGIECDKVVMNYPSTLCVYINSKDAAKQTSKIEIKDSRINGSILLLTTEPGTNSNKSKILIKESTVQGIVYSENNTELYGSVFGTVYTNCFLFYKKPTEYYNWLVDFNINRKKLDGLYLQPLGFTAVPKLAILREKWEF